MSELVVGVDFRRHGMCGYLREASEGYLHP